MKEKYLYFGTCFVNLVISLIMISLLRKMQLINYTLRDARIDNYLHNRLFNTIVTQVDELSSVLCIACLVVSIVLVVIAIIFRDCREYITAHRLLFSAVTVNLASDLVYILTNIFVGNCRILNENWILIIFLILLEAFVIFLGTADLLKLRKKKWDVIIAGGIFVLCICIITIPVLFSVKDNLGSAIEIRSLISDRPEDVRKEFESQIGNYFNGFAVEAEDKIYYIRSVDASVVSSVDADGHYETFWTTKEGIARGLFYHNGYLYVSTHEFYTRNYGLVRIELATGTEETIYTADDYFYFGVADGKLYYTTPMDEEKLCDVLCFDLSDENIGENSVLYDTGICYYDLNYNIFVARYLYNNSCQSVMDLGWHGQNWNNNVYENCRYQIEFWDKYSGMGDLVKKDYDWETYTEAMIDSEVMYHSIFEDKLYYIREKDGIYCEVICCDLQGDQKKVIATFEKEEKEKCYNLGISEDLILVQMRGEAHTENAYFVYIVKLEDGSIMQIQ